MGGVAGAVPLHMSPQASGFFAALSLELIVELRPPGSHPPQFEEHGVPPAEDLPGSNPEALLLETLGAGLGPPAALGLGGRRGLAQPVAPTPDADHRQAVEGAPPERLFLLQ